MVASDDILEGEHIGFFEALWFKGKKRNYMVHVCVVMGRSFIYSKWWPRMITKYANTLGRVHIKKSQMQTNKTNKRALNCWPINKIIQKWNIRSFRYIPMVELIDNICIVTSHKLIVVRSFVSKKTFIIATQKNTP